MFPSERNYINKNKYTVITATYRVLEKLPRLSLPILRMPVTCRNLGRLLLCTTPHNLDV
jgi:hypothetical protein